MAKNITAIVFDCFGVLTSDGWLPFAQHYFGDNASLMQEARDLNKQVDSGLIDYNTFVQAVAKMAQVEPSLAYKQIENNIANTQIFNYIVQLKAQYKIGMLSNAGKNWLDQLFTPQQIALFDACVMSYELGVVKPHPKMYLTVCERLGVQPQNAVFIDDIERYAYGAKEVGMQYIVYKEFAQLKDDLQALLINSDK